MKVTWIAYSHHLNPGKYAALTEQAGRLGPVRSEAWQRYGSIAGADLGDRQVSDRWLADGTYRRFGVLANYQIDAADMKTSARPCGTREMGVDRGYTEVLTDSDGQHHGIGLGRLLTVESDHRKAKGRARAKLFVHVNAAYTAQVDHRTGLFGVRKGEKLHCFDGVVLHADVNAAINVLHRLGGADITLHVPHRVVKQILQERAGRHRIRLPIQDSSRTSAGGERIIQPCSTLSNE